MSKGLQWIIGIGVVLVVIAVIFSAIAPYFLPARVWSGDVFCHLPSRMERPWGMHDTLGWIPFGRGLGLIVPLLVLGAVVVAGVLWLALRRRKSAPPTAEPAAEPTTPCPECGQPGLTTWKACPYCGAKRE